MVGGIVDLSFLKTVVLLVEIRIIVMVTICHSWQHAGVKLNTFLFKQIAKWLLMFSMTVFIRLNFGCHCLGSFFLN